MSVTKPTVKVVETNKFDMKMSDCAILEKELMRHVIREKEL